VNQSTFRKRQGFRPFDSRKAGIESLPGEEFAEILRWLSEKHWEKWDKEIAAGSKPGRRDSLMRAARQEKAQRTFNDL
jgi:hypothetical protein